MQEDINQNTTQKHTINNTKKDKKPVPESSKSYSKQNKLQKLEKAITNTYDPDNPLSNANNKGERINKKALMYLTPEEHFEATIADMAKQIEESRLREDDPANTKRFSSYLCNNDNKAFHLEIIKRAFTKRPVYLDPDEFVPVAVEYFDHCYKYDKMPTMAGLSSFAGISYSTFRNWLSEPQNLFHPVAQTISDIIHDMTLSATIDGNVNFNILKLLGHSEWGYKDNDQDKTTNININYHEQKTEQEKLDHINALKLSHTDYQVKDE